MAISLVLAACGGGDDDSESTPVSGTTSVPTELKAENILPDLTSLGMTVTQKQADPAAAAFGLDRFRAQYTGKMTSIVVITVLKDEKDATQEFNASANALKNPPPEYVGAGVAQADLTPTSAGDLAKAYVTAKTDQQGNLVWTDIYRFGRVVAIVQLLGRDGPDIVSARTKIADAIAAKSK